MQIAKVKQCRASCMPQVMVAAIEWSHAYIMQCIECLVIDPMLSINNSNKTASGLNNNQYTSSNSDLQLVSLRA